MNKNAIKNLKYIGMFFLKVFLIFCSLPILFGIYFSMQPNKIIKNYTMQETQSIVGKDLVLHIEDIKNVLFSQIIVMTFLGDSSFDTAIEITSEATKRLIEKNTPIGKFEYKSITTLQKCGFYNYDTHQNFNIPSDFSTGSFYYVSSEIDYRGGKTMILDDQRNILYYCSSNN